MAVVASLSPTSTPGSVVLESVEMEAGVRQTLQKVGCRAGSQAEV